MLQAPESWSKYTTNTDFYLKLLVDCFHTALQNALVPAAWIMWISGTGTILQHKKVCLSHIKSVLWGMLSVWPSRRNVCIFLIIIWFHGLMQAAVVITTMLFVNLTMGDYHLQVIYIKASYNLSSRYHINTSMMWWDFCRPIALWNTYT